MNSKHQGVLVHSPRLAFPTALIPAAAPAHVTSSFSKAALALASSSSSSRGPRLTTFDSAAEKTDPAADEGPVGRRAEGGGIGEYCPFSPMSWHILITLCGTPGCRQQQPAAYRVGLSSHAMSTYAKVRLDKAPQFFIPHQDGVLAYPAKPSLQRYTDEAIICLVSQSTQLPSGRVCSSSSRSIELCGGKMYLLHLLGPS